MLRLLFALVLPLLTAAGCDWQAREQAQQDKKILLVGVASSLAPVVRSYFKERANIRIESGGSLALIRRQTQLGRNYAVLLLADLQLGEQLNGHHWQKPGSRIAQARIVLALNAAVNSSETIQELLKAPYRLALAHADLAPLGYRSAAYLKLYEQALPASARSTFSSWLQGAQVYPDAALTGLSLQTQRAELALLYLPTARALKLKSLELSFASQLKRARVTEQPRQVFKVERAVFGGFSKKSDSPQGQLLLKELRQEKFQRQLLDAGFELPESSR